MSRSIAVQALCQDAAIDELTDVFDNDRLDDGGRAEGMVAPPLRQAVELCSWKAYSRP